MDRRSPAALSDRRAVAARIAELQARHRTPFVSVAVIADREIAWADAWGLAGDGDAATEAGPETLLQAASLSKPVAATVALIAAREGRFDLDHDINAILGSWRLPMGPFADGPKVTPRRLLSHTAGLGDGFGFPGYAPGAPLPTLAQILDGQPPSPLPAVRLSDPPGSVCRYSGGGVTILQLALADVHGLAFDALARSRVLGPLGMARSTFEQPLPPALWPQAALGHEVEDGDPDPGPWRVHPEQAAAGLWSTPCDLARFLIEVQRALAGLPTRLLDPCMAREMVTPVSPGPFGLGFRVGDDGRFGHTGSNWGYCCEMWAHPTDGSGVVVMTNASGGGALIRELLAS